MPDMESVRTRLNKIHRTVPIFRPEQTKQDTNSIVVGAYTAILYNLVSESGFLSLAVLLGGPIIILFGVATVQLLRISYDLLMLNLGLTDATDIDQNSVTDRESAIVEAEGEPDSLLDHTSRREYVELHIDADLQD